MFSAGSDLLCAGCCLSPHQQKNIYIVHAKRAQTSESEARRSVVLLFMHITKHESHLPCENNPQKNVHFFFVCVFLTCFVAFSLGVFVASVFL